MLNFSIAIKIVIFVTSAESPVFPHANTSDPNGTKQSSAKQLKARRLSASVMGTWRSHASVYNCDVNWKFLTVT